MLDLEIICSNISLCSPETTLYSHVEQRAPWPLEVSLHPRLQGQQGPGQLTLEEPACAGTHRRLSDVHYRPAAQMDESGRFDKYQKARQEHSPPPPPSPTRFSTPHDGSRSKPQLKTAPIQLRFMPDQMPGSSRCVSQHNVPLANRRIVCHSLGMLMTGDAKQERYSTSIRTPTRIKFDFGNFYRTPSHLLTRTRFEKDSRGGTLGLNLIDT